MSKKISAEEILEKHLTKRQYSEFTNCIHGDASQVKKAMNEFADQEKQIEAIAFAEWLFENKIERTTDGGFIWREFRKRVNTIDELYLLFQQSKNK